jgi:hypothetical protein
MSARHTCRLCWIIALVCGAWAVVLLPLRMTGML